MSQRDEIMSRFGPLLLEAFALMVLDEINILRQQLGLQPRTPQQLLNQIGNHSTTLPKYDWMLDQ